MNTTKLASSALLALALSASAHAVHLDPGGRGQVLIYPYYTVNKHQQTYLSVTNTSSATQAARLRFREGYNGRTVLDLNVFLPPYDSWTGTVFALRDVGIDSNGAAILTPDSSCTSPAFSESGTSTGGRSYIAFSDAAYTNAPTGQDDGGPYTIERTREGYVEIIAMADLAVPLSSHVAHGNNGSAPTGCALVRNLTGSEPELTVPSGGLMGSASVINVGQGTFLSARAEALGGFTYIKLFLPPERTDLPTLRSVNQRAGVNTIEAHVVDDRGKAQTLTYSVSSRLQAVEAVLMADHIYNEFQNSASLSAASEWVVTMPTKFFDTQYRGPLFPYTHPPFHCFYRGPAGAYCPVLFKRTAYGRNGEAAPADACSPECPPLVSPLPSFRFATNVMPVAASQLDESPVLGSRLTTGIAQSPPPSTVWSGAGWMDVQLNPLINPSWQLTKSEEFKVLNGLPVVGFWATTIVNNNVSGGVLANYAAAVRHASSTSCLVWTRRDGMFVGPVPCE